MLDDRERSETQILAGQQDIQPPRHMRAVPCHLQSRRESGPRASCCSCRRGGDSDPSLRWKHDSRAGISTERSSCNRPAARGPDPRRRLLHRHPRDGDSGLCCRHARLWLRVREVDIPSIAEVKFPVAYEDCWDALVWVRDNLPLSPDDMGAVKICKSTFMLTANQVISQRAKLGSRPHQGLRLWRHVCRRSFIHAAVA